MYSIRNHSSALLGLLVIGASLSGLAGCQVIHNTPPEALNTTPVIVDQAMQARDWDRTVALYANGSTPAYPLTFKLEPKPGLPEWQYYPLDVPLYVGQAIAAPVTFFIPPPWTTTIYTDATIEPTYHAVPPVQIEPVTTEKMSVILPSHVNNPDACCK